MDNHEVQPHSHSTVDGNLVEIGRRNEEVKNGLGLVIGFRMMRIFKCRICGAEIKEVGPNVAPISLAL